MQDVITGDAGIIDALSALCGGDDAVCHKADQYGNASHWFRLTGTDKVVPAAKVLKKAGARLIMISSYDKSGGLTGFEPELCYHFEVPGVIYNFTVALDATNPAVPSITPLFANADWHERELRELLSIKVEGHPNPNRLFLDETLDAGKLRSAVPLSVAMNGANSTDLWETILGAKEKQA